MKEYVSERKRAIKLGSADAEGGRIQKITMEDLREQNFVTCGWKLSASYCCLL